MADEEKIFASTTLADLGRSLHALHLVTSKHFALLDERVTEVGRKIDRIDERIAALERGTDTLGLIEGKRLTDLRTDVNGLKEVVTEAKGFSGGLSLGWKAALTVGGILVALAGAGGAAALFQSLGGG